MVEETQVEEIDYEEIDESYDTDMLTDLAEQQLELQMEIAALNDQIDEKQGRLTTISKKQLPRAMAFLRMSSFSLATGQGVTIKKNYFGSIKDNEEDAIEYLKKFELDDIVKNVVSVEFQRGEETRATELHENLMKMGYSVEKKETIHGSTLKSFIKERCEEKEKLDEMFRDELDLAVPENKDSDNWDRYLEFAVEKDMLQDAIFPRQTFKVMIVEEAQVKEPKRKKKKARK